MEAGQHITAAFFDQVAPTYDRHYARPVDVAEDAWVARRLRSIDGCVLDLGCGTGKALELAPAFADNYVGLDISAGMLTEAERRHANRGQFFRRDMADLAGFYSGGFDAVVSIFGSLSYCLNPRRAMLELHRVLRPGGRVFLMTYGVRYFWRRHHIAGAEIPIIPYSARALRTLVAGLFAGEVVGLNLAGEALPRRVGPAGARRFLSLEAATLGRLAPSLCYWLVFEGVKP